MNITITGNPGGGKTSVCNVLKERGYEIISGGSIFRQIASEKGMTVVELNEYAKKDKSIDDLIDTRTTELSKTNSDIVFDCRLGWHFAVDSFKVFVFVNNYTAASRVFHDDKRNAEKYSSVEDAEKYLRERSMLEQERFRVYYNINYYDVANYDLLIDATFATPSEIADEVIRNYEEFKKAPFARKIEIDVRSILPPREDPAPRRELTDCYAEEERNAPASRCAVDRAGERPVVVHKDGHNYAVKGYEQILAAKEAGKIYCCIDRLRTDPELGQQITEPGTGDRVEYLIDLTK